MSIQPRITVDFLKLAAPREQLADAVVLDVPPAGLLRTFGQLYEEQTKNIVAALEKAFLRLLEPVQSTIEHATPREHLLHVFRGELQFVPVSFYLTDCSEDCKYLIVQWGPHGSQLVFTQRLTDNAIALTHED